MDDESLIGLFFERNEKAISELILKYGNYCHSIAKNILGNDEDAEECLNDTALRVWNSIPPANPVSLKLFCARITRNIAFDRYRALTSERRGGAEVTVCLDEAEEFLAGTPSVSDEYERAELSRAINRFLHSLPARECDIFIRRYFYCDSTADIAARYSLKESHVLVILSRTRKKLKEHLQKGGYSL